ncbi:TPM domain-containing protein [Clostridium sp. PL3]|uniref:TPM domain-containing protein n=1 Tax=Clostridium thailandense TaxID=2794346 RepID=A0A949TLM9_9CLOT|nr:TPM domain-containing protein [Clostridium thailandense]MBV7274620.1 TPM domain-containing protein [Clostridium thailandense]
MKLKKLIFLSVLFVFLITNVTLAAAAYVKDDAGVLSASTTEQINSNFQKLEKNTGAQARIVIIKSLQGKNMNDYADSLVKTMTSTDKYAIFIVATADHKSKFLFGAGLNAVFTSSEANRIAKLPDSDFKKSDFNTGILKIGKTIDEDITTKAVKTGQVKVVDNGLSKTVQAKQNHTGLIIFLIIAALIIIITVYYIKKKGKERVDRFARENGLNGDSSRKSNHFRSANLSEEEPIYNKYSNSTNPTQGERNVVNNTTVINQNGGYGNNGSGFVEGMIVGEMLSHNHHDSNHYVHDDDYHDNSYNHNDYSNDNTDSTYIDDDTKLSSGSWGMSSGESDWGNSSSDNSYSDSSSGSSDW